MRLNFFKQPCVSTSEAEPDSWSHTMQQRANNQQRHLDFTQTKPICLLGNVNQMFTAFNTFNFSANKPEVNVMLFKQLVVEVSCFCIPPLKHKARLGLSVFTTEKTCYSF